MPRWFGGGSRVLVKKFTVTKTTDVTLHTITNISQITLWKGLRKSLIIPCPKIVRHVFRACHTKATGMMYCIPVPAYDPVKLTKLAKLSVKYVITIGGRMANNGNVHRQSKNWQKLEYAASGLVRCVLAVPMNSASKLFRNVIAMIGKLADKVNTGKIERIKDIRSVKMFL